MKDSATPKEIMDIAEGMIRAVGKAHSDFLDGIRLTESGFAERCAVYIAYRALARTFDVCKLVDSAETLSELMRMSDMIYLPTRSIAEGSTTLDPKAKA